MKKLILSATLLISVATFAQKDELKTLKKIYGKSTPSTEDVQTYKATLNALSTLVTDEADKTASSFYSASLPIVEIKALGKDATSEQSNKVLSTNSIIKLSEGYLNTLVFETKSGKKVFTDDVNKNVSTYKQTFINYVVALDGEKKYDEISQILYSIYKLDKSDKEKLYYAGNYAVNGNNYDKAIDYFKELVATDYTGEATYFFAKSKATGAEEPFNDKTTRDSYVKLGTHEAPRDEKIASKRGEIYKLYAMLLIEKNRVEEAKIVLQDAKKTNPEDVGLIIAEANMYFKLNDMTTYKKLINEAYNKNPNDVELNFNLGVLSAESKQMDDAKKYYRKAIELDPKYTNAYINLAFTELAPDTKIVEDMNKLGTSANDLKKYNALKAERVKLFNAALPLLEKAYELDSANESVKSNLLEVYSFLEMTEKYKALKAK